MVYDVIIIGAGPAGLAAAIYSSRARLNTLLIEKNGCGGQMIVTDLLENYPGFNGGINGFDLALKLQEQAKEFGAEIIYDEVVSLQDGNIKKVVTVNNFYQTKTIIIASGTHVKKMNIPGESAFIGKGVSFCATCDAPFYKDKDVVVIGGGDSAIQEAIYLSKFAKNVTIVHRKDSLKAAKILQEKLLSYSNISIMYSSVPNEIIGTSSIEKIRITNIKTSQVQELNANGVFVFIGLLPNTDFITNILLDNKGYVITDENMHTSIVGIFACGDVRKKQLRQVITATSDGAQAAVSAAHYLETL
ncbi:MAG: thioredoxin-disulfide reductase [Endomicrobium sp.]|jgi:thioredoxin reductase (NADPH)|nr:thioredoxin-disulfide reductase [Endomicrobium sp.]